MTIDLNWRKMGVSRAVNVSRENLKDVMNELGMKEGFDVALEVSGSGSFSDHVRHHEPRWQNCTIRIPPCFDGNTDWSQVIFKGLFIKGIYGREMFENMV